MADNNTIKLKGKISEVCQSGVFKVTLENNVEVIAHVSGKIRMNRIRILLGDMVDVELSPYDLTRGRIVYRY